MKSNPYILSLPAKGKSFYNRQEELDAILHHSQQARHTHLLGMRGTGKTSILLKIAETKPSLYFSFQAIEGEEDFQDEIEVELMDKEELYPWLSEVEIHRSNSVTTIRRAAILARQNGHALFLLFDEIEGWLEFDTAFLKKIGRLLDGTVPVCVVLASAKNISSLNEKVIASGGSPLPFPSPRYLTPFEDEAASALICQSASDEPLNVPLSTMEAIKDHTNNQPQLIQWLCSHLWSRNQDPARWQITDELFHVPKHDQLAHRFQADFNYLSPQERRILRAVLHNEPVPADIPPARRKRFLKGLSTLGYLRQVNRRYQIGNTFLLRWFEDNKDTLDWQDTTQQPSDEATLGMYEQEPSEEVTQTPPKKRGGRRLSKENEWLYKQILELRRNETGAIREWEDIYPLIRDQDAYFDQWRTIKGKGKREDFRKALKRMIKKAQKG